MSVLSSPIELVCAECEYRFRSRVRGGNTTCPECRASRYVRVDPEPEWRTAPDRPAAPAPGRPIACSGCAWSWSTRAKDESGVRCPRCGKSVWIPRGGPRPLDAARPIRPASPRRPAPPARPAPTARSWAAPTSTRTRATPPPPAPTAPPAPRRAPAPAAPAVTRLVLGQAAPAPRGAAAWPEQLGLIRRPNRPGRCDLVSPACTGAAVFRWSDPHGSPVVTLDTCDTCSAAVAQLAAARPRITRTVI